METERKIVDKIRGGDHAAFKTLFNHHKRTVFNICCRIVCNEEEAEDLCQEVFVKVYQSIHKFQHHSQLSTWIYRIAVNNSLNHVRRKRLFRSIPLYSYFFDSEADRSLPESPELRPDRLLEKKERDKIIASAVGTLTDKQKVALVLQKYEGFSCKEITEILDCSMAQVQSLLQRAKKNLYKRLQPYLEKI